jgi:multiple antibiotic resistance protein
MMLEAAKNLLLIVSALFPIVDPLGGSAFFLAMTDDYEPGARRLLSWQIAVNSFILLVGSYFIGTYILEFFGISLPIVQVGGGIVLIAMGWAILMQQDGGSDATNRKNIQTRDAAGQAFYPLTLPLTVGPGSISVAITLGANAAHHHDLHILTILAAVVGSAVIGLSIFLCYGFADRLARVLGQTGMSVMIKLSSFLLLCIGAQIVWNGTKDLLESVTVHIAH